MTQSIAMTSSLSFAAAALRRPTNNQMNSAFTTSITALKADAAPYTPPTPKKGGVDQSGRSSVSPNSVVSNLYHRADTQYCVVIDPQIPPKPLQQRSRPYNKRTDTTFQSIDTATPRRRGSTSRSSSRTSSSTPSPQKNKKNFKTEPCKNLSELGYCKYGDKCHFYHHERERRERVGDKSIPCLLGTISGMCPYGSRCKYMHPPGVMCEVDSGIVLPHLTKATGSTAEPDPLYHQKTKDIEQTNPIVANRLSNKTFMDTCKSVCNVGADILPRLSSSDDMGDIVATTHNATALNELQKLCIVLQITLNDSFVYNPENCFNGQPCMTLQMKFFRLVSIDSSGMSISSPGDVVVEIDAYTYQSGKIGPSPDMFVSAQEVVFDSKGKVTCNHSIWFDAAITIGCSSTKAKKSSQKDQEDEWDMKGESLFVVPNNEEFKNSLSAIATSPYVCMQTVEDLETDTLIKGILNHRIATILFNQYGMQLDCITSAAGDILEGYPGKLERMYSALEGEFNLLSNEWKSRMWSASADTKNRMIYSPSTLNTMEGELDTAHIWNSFVANLSSTDDSTIVPKKSKRLHSVTTSLDDDDFVWTILPNAVPSIERVDTKLVGLLKKWEGVVESERISRAAKKNAAA